MFLMGSKSKYNQAGTANALLLESNVHTQKILGDRTNLRLPTMPLASRSRSIASQMEHPCSSVRMHASKKDIEADSKSELGRRFVEQVEESLKKSNFVSLILRGVKKEKRKKKDEDDLLRGSIRQVQGRLVMVSSSKKKKKSNSKIKDKKMLLLQVTLKYHGATDICKNFQLEDAPKTIYDLILGDPIEMASEWGVQAVRSQHIQSAQLTTTNRIWDLRLDDKASLRKQNVKNGLGTDESTTKLPIPISHDRVKQVPLSNQADFFKRLGVTNVDGRPKPRMKGKLRQCQKFVEIVGRIVDECQKKERKKISVVDMGCGRAYLTFSLHAYLQERYGLITTTGIDVRPKLVAEISGIARSLGSTFDSLTFEEGTIEKVVAQTSSIRKQATGDVTLNVLVALHACDTATDDALYSGIARNADVIVIAPCCHKQVRPQLNSHFTSTRESHPLSSILKHGVYRERMSETVTDSLRALLLEYAGYKVQVFEFIGGEHTSKNVMITAIKASKQAANDKRKVNVELLRQEIVSLASLHGISNQKLAQLMEFDLVDERLSIPRQTSRKNSKSQLSKHRMPPARL